MWPMIAAPGLHCSECRHSILTGRLCLSELPEETPKGVNRGDFKNYCIGCPQCWSQGKHACYVRHLESNESVGKTPRSLPCARCGRRIGAGEKAGVDIYYEWPEATAEGNASNAVCRLSATGTVMAATGIDALVRGVPNGSWESLIDNLQGKFVNAGLGGERGVRTVAEAQAFYRDSIPHPVRNLGGDAVDRFVAGKDASHIQSVHNAPHLADSNSNFIWENSAVNRARGAADMTSADRWQAHATNAFDSAGIVFRDCLETAGMTAMYAGLLEAPVAAIENYLHYKRGRMTGEEAVKEAAMAIGKRAGTGAVVGFAVTGAVALMGAGPLLVTIAPVLLPVGMGLYAYSALKRIMDAASYDQLRPDSSLPLVPVGTYFCSPRCHTKFAYETGHSALMRWEASRVTAMA